MISYPLSTYVSFKSNSSFEFFFFSSFVNIVSAFELSESARADYAAAADVITELYSYIRLLLNRHTHVTRL